MKHGVGVVIALVIACACSRVEQPYRFYESQAKAHAAGEIDRGWLPSWVPTEARNLHIQGDMDTNRWWVRFTLGRAEATKLKSALIAVPDSEVAASIALSAPSYGNWWFDGLIQKQPANDGALNAEIFRSNDCYGQCIIAVDRVSNEIYIWGK